MIKQELIQTVYYRSPIRIKVRIKNWAKGDRQPFKFVYKSTGGSQTVTASYDGIDFTDCKEWEHGVLILIPAKTFQPGTLRVERTYYENIDRYNMGCYSNIESVETSIEILDVNNNIVTERDVIDEFDPIQSESVYEVAVENGYEGTQEEFNKALANAHEEYFPSAVWPTTTRTFVKVEGEKWPDETGALKQVYAVSFKGTLPGINTGFMIEEKNIHQAQIIMAYAIDQENECNRSINEIGVLLYKLNGMLGATINNPSCAHKPYFILAKCTLKEEPVS